jgi:hypothetical protein
MGTHHRRMTASGRGMPYRPQQHPDVLQLMMPSKVGAGGFVRRHQYAGLAWLGEVRRRRALAGAAHEGEMASATIYGLS